MSAEKQKSKNVTPISTKGEESPPSREERAAKLHQSIKLANPGRNVAVTVGDKYGPESVHISTKSRIGEDVMGGVALGVLGVGAAAALIMVVTKVYAKKASAKEGKAEPIEVSED